MIEVAELATEGSKSKTNKIKRERKLSAIHVNRSEHYFLP